MWKSETRTQERFSEQYEERVRDTISSESVQASNEDVPTQVFYVCFSSSGDYPFRGLLKKNFTHVSIFERIPLGFIVHDPNRCALDTYILPATPTEEFLISFLKQRPDYTIVEVIKEATNRESHLIRFGFQTCVNVVAYIMGVTLPWYCLTPYGLYKRIMKGDKSILNIRKVNYERQKRS